MLPMISAMKPRRSFHHVKISIAIFLLAFYCTGTLHELLELCPRVGDGTSDQHSEQHCALCALLQTPSVPACTIVVLAPPPTAVTTTFELVDHAIAPQREIARPRAPPSSFVHT